MSYTATWGYSPSTPITSFEVYKSTDGGLNYALVETVAFDLNGANFRRSDRLFFYVDAAGAPGDIYKIIAVGDAGESEPVFVFVPPARPALCTIFGYVMTAFGEVDQTIKVMVDATGNPQERWVKKAEGMRSQAERSLGIIGASNTVFPDEAGMWQVTLVQGVFAVIRIEELDFTIEFEVPATTGPVNIRDVPQLRSGSYEGNFSELTGSRNRITTG